MIFIMQYIQLLYQVLWDFHFKWRKKMKKIIYLIIAVFFLIILKYFLSSMKNKSKVKNKKNNVYYPKEMASSFIIVSPFLMFVILIVTFFWKTDSIYKLIILIYFLIMDISFIIYSCYIYTWKIEIKNDSFILCCFARKKEYNYKDVVIKNKTYNEILYVNNKRILKTNSYMMNSDILIKKIVEYNNYQNIIY